MNILFFLTPKSEVIYVNEEDTVGQAMDTMEKYKYSAVPIITKAGRYAECVPYVRAGGRRCSGA